MRHHRSTGWGLGERRIDPPSVLIFNFDVGSAQLKLEHREMLHSWVVPRLKFGHSIAVVGLTSRTGGTVLNRHLSWMRSQKTLDFFRAEVGESFAARPAIGFGELKAKAEGYRDNSEDPRFRSVVILVGPKGVPPFPPALFDVTPLVPDSLIPDESKVDFGKVNDVLSGIAQFLELMPWDKIAAVGENLDLATALVGAVYLMPALWADVREQNLNNGRMEGYWEGMQNMANRYSDPNLTTTPLSKWPALRAPQPGPLGALSGDGLNQREWMEGKREGCDKVYDLIELMEREPPVIKSWEITGRRYLFLLYQKFGKNISAAIKQVVITRLGVHHKSWPLTG